MAETTHISRNEVIEGLRKVAERGIVHPDDLDRTDQEVKQAQERMFAYVNQEDEKAKQAKTPEAIYENRFDQATLEVDAGFTDPEYLDEVANDWLVQDEQDARDIGLIDLGDKIQLKIDEINAQLEQ
jgi:hypothetical protein